MAFGQLLKALAARRTPQQHKWRLESGRESMSLLEAVVKVVASITACYMCLSPLPATLGIHRKQSTGHMPSLPLVLQWAYNHTWMLYGYLTGNYFPLLTTYLIGSIASIGFLTIYCAYCSDRAWVARLVALGFALNGLATLFVIVGSRTTYWSSNETVNAVGVLGIAIGLALFASPFATISQVIRTRTAASIPIGMVAVGLLSNSVWLLYGFLLSDAILIIPTAISGCFCLVQTALYVAYRHGDSPDKAALDTDATEGDTSDSTMPTSPSATEFAVCSTPANALKLPTTFPSGSLTDELRSPVPSIVVHA